MVAALSRVSTVVYEQSGAEQGKAAILSPSFHFSETIINKLLTIFSFIIRNDSLK